MGTAQDIMSKTPASGGSATRKVSQNERRNSRRCKITQLMRIRPSDPERDISTICAGPQRFPQRCFFPLQRVKYQIGMRLFVSMPYTRTPPLQPGIPRRGCPPRCSDTNVRYRIKI